MATKTSSRKRTSSRASSAKKTAPQQVSKSAAVKTKHNKKALIIIGGILVFLLVIFVAKNFVIAATVNGQPISRITVIKELEKQGGQQTLNGLITKALILQEAKKRNITVSQKDMDAEIKKIEDSLKQQSTTLDAALALQGMTRQELDDQIRLQLLVQKMVQGNVKITDDQVAKYIKDNSSYFPESATEDEKVKEAKDQLEQQQMSTETQKLIDQLQKNAKTVYFIKY